MPEKKLRAEPAASLITQFNEYGPLSSSTKVLDLACGGGRNGLWFSAKGCDVTYLDKNLDSLNASLQASPLCHLLQWDLEDGSAPGLPEAEFDIILVFNYLHRPLFAQLMDAVKPGGLIVYETFTRQQAQIGRPKNPDFLLQDGELRALFANWSCLYYSEDLMGQLPDASFKARLIARKPE